MFQKFIAWKYATSRFLTFGAFLLVSLSVAILVILMAVMEGFRTEMIERIRGTSTDLRVEATNFDGLQDHVRVAGIVESVDGVRAALPYVDTFVAFQVLLPPEYPSLHYYLRLQALDLEREAAVGRVGEYFRNYSLPFEPTGLPQTLEETLSRDWVERGLYEWNRRRWRPGNRLLRTEPPPGIEDLQPVILGEEVFYPTWRYDILGHVVELNTISPVTNQPRTRRFVLAGFFRSKDVEQDNHTILMDLADAGLFLDLRDPVTGKTSVSGLRVYLQPGEDVDSGSAAVKRELRRAEVPFVQVRTWREDKPKILRAVKMEKLMVGIILGVIVIFVGLMIFIILTVLFVERMRDVGVLLAVGGGPSSVAGIYLRIGAGICLGGLALGSVIGLGFCFNIDLIQRWVYILTGFEVFPKSVYYIDSIPARPVLSDFVFITLPTVLVGFLSSYFAARRAASKDPVEALRYE